MCLLSCSVVSDSFVTSWMVVHPAPLFMGFSRQESWSGLPFPSPEDLPNPGIKLRSPGSPALAGRFFLPLSHLGSPIKTMHIYWLIKTSFLLRHGIPHGCTTLCLTHCGAFCLFPCFQLLQIPLPWITRYRHKAHSPVAGLHHKCLSSFLRNSQTIF